MNKQITIKYNGKDYTLEFTRKTAKLFIQMGYKLTDVIEKAVVAVIPFVMCAFKQHHAGITEAKAEEIYMQIPTNQKTAFLNALVEMYSDTYTSIIGDENAEDNEGNATWGTNWEQE